MGATRALPEKASTSLAGRLACVAIVFMLSVAACWSLPATMQAAAAWRTSHSRRGAVTLAAPPTAGLLRSGVMNSGTWPQQQATAAGAGRPQQQSAATFAVLSSGSNPVYSFFIPLTALIWRRRQQFEPLIILLNDVRGPQQGGAHSNWSSSAHTSVVLKYLERWRMASNTLALEHDEAAGRNNAALLSQLSRLFAAGLCGSVATGPLQGLSHPDSWLVTTDVDIWPVAPPSFWLTGADDGNPSRPSLGKITNAFCCLAGYSVLGLRVNREYPMTTAAFQVKTWQQLLNYTCICSSPQHCSTALSSHMNGVARRVFDMRPGVAAPPEQWYWDQRLLSYSVHARPDIHNRTQLVARSTKADRIDRIAWPRVPEWSEQLLQQYADAHVLRPGYADHHWRPLLQLLRPLLRLDLAHDSDAKLWREVQQYQREFADAMLVSTIPAPQ